MTYRTPLALFADRADADSPLAELAQAYFDYLAGREQPASKATITKYMETLVSFSKSLVLHGKPTVISSVNLLTIRQWVSDQRAGTLPSARVGRPTDKCADGSIGPRYAALKAFIRSPPSATRSPCPLSSTFVTVRFSR